MPQNLSGFESLGKGAKPASPAASNPFAGFESLGAPAPEAPAPSGSVLPGLGAVAGGAAALAGAAYLAKSGKFKPALDTLNAIRQQLMLSGWAPLKSILGNVGAAGIESAERKSMAPLQELFSGQTWQDVKAAWHAGTPAMADGTYGATLKVAGHELPTPGRVMGALDNASQKAFVRAGLTEEEAAKTLLQAPMKDGPLKSALDSPVARYLIPFRRTPFNQFFEGFETLKPANLNAHPYVVGGTAAAGAVHGAATSDERYPWSVGLGTAASARYGVPYALGAIGGRLLAGGKGGAELAGTILPVSEYGITSGMEDPVAPFREPSALRALKQMTGVK